ncbi:MAG: MBL fold metallo-hydrolase [Clostridiales bacterium]|nr:MBL fold metallo-hydrolase [Clostridiales bacterium]
MKITYIGHACFLIEDNEGHKLAIDPYQPKSVPGLADHGLVADQAVCSHGHYDHDDIKGVKKPANVWNGSFDISTVSTYHDDVKGAARGLNNITIVNVDGGKIVHMGDIGCELTETQLDQIRNCDVLLIPVGGHYTIDSKQAFAMTKAINPRTVIPMHFRGPTFGYNVISTREEFERLVINEGGRAVIRNSSVLGPVPAEKCLVLLDPLRA